MVKCDKCGRDVPAKEAETVTIYGEPWHYCGECYNRLLVEARRRRRKAEWRRSVPTARTPS